MNKTIANYIKKNFLEIAIILVVTFVALILRLLLLKNYGDLWLDELYSWYFASQKTIFETVFELLKQDLHMPLYFIILHFWMKIFGNSDISMHLCTMALTIPLVPLSFYVVKNIFNKSAAYFSILALTINAFCIYYSIEVRFYGLVFVLALLSAFFFVKMLETFEKKYITGFIISHGLLLYTFSIAPLLTFCYGLVGGIYLFIKKNENQKKYYKVLGIVATIALPTVLFTLYNFILMKTQTICSFSKDIYAFNWLVILDVLENFFTNDNYQLLTGQINVYLGFIDKFHYPDYIIFVFFPLIIGIAGVIRCIFSKNEKLYLFLLPSLLFFAIALVIGALEINSFLTRYASIIFPVFVCSACYGLSLIRPKTLSIILFICFLVLNSSFYFVVKRNIFSINRIALGNLPNIMSAYIMPFDDDLILIPYSEKRVKRYIQHGNVISFNLDDALLLKDKESKDFYFGIGKDVNRSNVKKILHSSVVSDKPYEIYEKNLYNKYILKMKKGQKFIIISFRDTFTMPLNLNWQILNDMEIYNNTNLFTFIMSKVLRDSVQTAEKYLVQKNIYHDERGEYSIYVYEKQ